MHLTLKKWRWLRMVCCTESGPEPGFMVSLGQKDLRLAIGLAKGYGCAVPVGQATMAVMAKAVESGLGRKDCSSLLHLHEKAAGTTVRLKGTGG